VSTLATTQTFTRTHARYLASKVVSDMYQCARLYGGPACDSVADYEVELVEMLVGGYVYEYEFGFKNDGKRVVSWQYAVNAAGDLVGGGTDDSAGSVYARAKIAGATYFNFMSYSQKWLDLSQGERDAARAAVPISRSTGTLPTDGSGYWAHDKTYTNGGTSVSRRTFRPS